MTVDQQLAAATAHLQQGRLDAAAEVYERILTQAPDTPEALYHSGMIRYEKGDVDGALARLAAAIRAAPDLLPLRQDYGAVLRVARRDRDALEQFEYVLRRQPGDGNALLNVGLAKRDLGDLPGAMIAVDQAVALLPPYAPGNNIQGVLRRERGDLTGAVDAFRKALAIDPNNVDAQNNLGMALHELGRDTEAEQALQQAARINPAFAPVHVNFGTLYMDMGDFEAAEAAFGRAVALDPAREDPRALLVHLHHYDPAWTGEAILAEARDWATTAIATVPGGIPAPAHRNPRDPERRLKVGYFSPDFREHACAHFLMPLLKAHDRSAVELFAYAAVERPDAVTSRFERAVDRWVDCSRLTAVQLAGRVAADGIDILVDCAGLTRGHRLGAFAFHPAPVQVAWLGYPGTTGLEAVGFRLTDALADPPGTSDRHFTEKLVRLNRPFLAWEPPPLGTSPAERPPGAPVMFGSFNNPAKINASLVELWAQILDAVPESRLTLKFAWAKWPRAERRVRELFKRAGVAAERLVLAAWIDRHEQHFAGYDAIDIALDPFPYNGTTTTLEALWMGVPVVTLAGDRHSARVGLDLLTAIGAPELIARDRQDYVARAVDLARDGARRETYRRTLRGQLAGSPLVDHRGFARAVEAAYRGLWRSWCAS